MTSPSSAQTIITTSTPTRVGMRANWMAATATMAMTSPTGSGWTSMARA